MGCTSISQVVQLLENKGLFVEVLTNAEFVIKHGSIPSESIENDYHCCSCWILFTEWIEINQYLNKFEKKHQTGKHWVSNVCVSSRACRVREEHEGVHSFKNSWSSIFGCTSLVTSTMIGNSVGIPKKFNILISKQKHSFSRVLLSASMKLLSETQFFWAFWSYMYWEGWTEMGHIFSWNCGSVNFVLP